MCELATSDSALKWLVTVISCHFIAIVFHWRLLNELIFGMPSGRAMGLLLEI